MPEAERVCEKNCPDYHGMEVLHAEQCICPCHKPISTPTEGSMEERFAKLETFTQNIISHIEGNSPVYRQKTFVLIDKAFITQEKERSVQATVEIIKGLGHQQEDGEIWCNMDEVLKALGARSPKP